MKAHNPEIVLQKQTGVISPKRSVQSLPETPKFLDSSFDMSILTRKSPEFQPDVFTDESIKTIKPTTLTLQFESIRALMDDKTVLFL